MKRIGAMALGLVLGATLQAGAQTQVDYCVVSKEGNTLTVCEPTELCERWNHCQWNLCKDHPRTTITLQPQTTYIKTAFRPNWDRIREIYLDEWDFMDQVEPGDLIEVDYAAPNVPSVIWLHRPWSPPDWDDRPWADEAPWVMRP